MGNEIKQKLTLDIGANLSNFKAAADEMNKSFNNLNLGKSDLRQVATLYQKLVANIEDLKTKSAQPIDYQDAKKVEKAYDSIKDDFIAMATIGKTLSKDMEDLVPSSVAKNLKDANTAILDFQKNIYKLQSTTNTKDATLLDLEKYKTKLSDTTTQIKNLKKEQKNLLTFTFDGKTTTYSNISGMRTAAGNTKNAERKEALKKAIVTYDSTDKTLSKTTETQISLQNLYTKTDLKVKTLTADIEKLQTALGGENETAAFAKLQETLTKLTGVDFSNIKDISEMTDALNNIKTSNLEKVNTTLKQIDTTTEDIKQDFGEATKKVEYMAKTSDHLKAMQLELDKISNSITTFFTLGNAIQLFKRAVTQAYQSVKELDAAMTQTAVVSKYTIDDMWKTLPEKTKQANKYGASIAGVYEVETLYYQQGLKTNEVTAVGAQTLKMAKIAGMDYAEATDAMTAALRGFNMEVNDPNSAKVNDVYSALAAQTASNVQELSTAMTKTASISASAGMEFANTSAFLAKIIETTRESAETAGTAMKTIVARFTEIKKNPNEALTDENGEIIDVNAIDSALRSVGVSLKDTQGQIRDLDDVFMDLGEKWGDLDKNTQRYIATIAAGSRQQSRFIAMMSDYERTMELVNIANNSAGASEKQFEKTIASLEYAVQQLKNEWAQFVRNLANQEVIKNVIKLLTFLLHIINQITTGFGLLNGGIGSFAITLTLVVELFKTLARYKGLFTAGIKNIVTAFSPQTISTNIKTGAESGATQAATNVKTVLGAAAYEAGTQYGKGVRDSVNYTTNPPNSGDPVVIPKKAGSGNKDPLPQIAPPIPNLLSGGSGKGFMATGISSIKGMSSTSKLLIAMAVAIGTELAQKIVALFTDTIKNNTASSKLAVLNNQLEEVDSALSTLTAQIESIPNIKQAYEDQIDIMRIANSTAKEYTKAQKSANKTIRNLISQTPELRQYANYVNGQWQVNPDFWSKYEKILDKQQIKLEEVQAALQYNQASLSYQSMRDDNTKNLSTISTEEANNISTAGKVGAGVGGVAGGVAGAITGAALGAPVPVIGPIIGAIIGGVLGALSGGAALGFGAALTGAAIAKSGMDEKTFNSYVDQISQQRDSFSQSELEQLSQGKATEDLAYIVDIFGGKTDEMSKFFKSFGDDVDTLNKIFGQRNIQQDILKQQIYDLATGLGIDQTTVNQLENIVSLEMVDKQDALAISSFNKRNLDSDQLLATGKSRKDYTEAYMFQVAVKEGNKWISKTTNNEIKPKEVISSIASLYAKDLLAQLIKDYEPEARQQAISSLGTDTVAGAYFNKTGNISAASGVQRLTDASNLFNADSINTISVALGEQAEKIFTMADISTQEGIYAFINSLEDVDFSFESIGTTSDDLTNALIEATNAAATFTNIIAVTTNQSSAYTKAAALGRRYTEAEYTNINKYTGFGNDFTKQGDDWIYTGNQFQGLAEALLNSQQDALLDYAKKYLSDTEGYTKEGLLEAFVQAGAYTSLSTSTLFGKREKQNALTGVAYGLGATEAQLTDVGDDLSKLVDLIKHLKKNPAIDQLTTEQRALYNAVVQEQQERIDALKDLKSTIESQNEKTIAALQNSISEFRQNRDNAKAESDLAGKEQQLAYLMADSMSSQSDIIALQKEIEEDRNTYADSLVDQQISKLESQGQTQIDQLQSQIDLQTAIKNQGIDNGKYIRQILDNTKEPKIDTTTEEQKTQLTQKIQDFVTDHHLREGDRARWGQVDGFKEMIKQANDLGIDLSVIEGYVDPIGPSMYSGPSAGEPLYDNEKDAYNQWFKYKGNLNTKTYKGETYYQLGNGKEYFKEEDIVFGLFGTRLKPENVIIPYKFAQGGLADFTGPAWLDGTKSKPEIVLNAKDSENFLQLKNTLANAQGGMSQLGGDNYYNVDIKVDSISSDYDVDRLAARIKQSINEDARYRNVNAINLIR